MARLGVVVWLRCVCVGETRRGAIFGKQLLYCLVCVGGFGQFVRFASQNVYSLVGVCGRAYKDILNSGAESLAIYAILICV